MADIDGEELDSTVANSINSGMWGNYMKMFQQEKEKDAMKTEVDA